MTVVSYNRRNLIWTCTMLSRDVCVMFLSTFSLLVIRCTSEVTCRPVRFDNPRYTNSFIFSQSALLIRHRPAILYVSDMTTLNNEAILGFCQYLSKISATHWNKKNENQLVNFVFVWFTVVYSFYCCCV